MSIPYMVRSYLGFIAICWGKALSIVFRRIWKQSSLLVLLLLLLILLASLWHRVSGGNTLLHELHTEWSLRNDILMGYCDAVTPLLSA